MAVQDGITDGYISFDAGQNEGSIPALIAESQTHRNINVTLKNRAVRPRPSVVDFELEFLSEEVRTKQVVAASLTYEQNYLFGRMQHSGKYQTPQGEFLVQVINGVIYATDFQSDTIRVIEVKGTQKLINYHLTRINGEQSDNEYVLHDWPNNPITITSDFTAFRSSSLNQGIPKSYIGIHVHDRLFVGNAGTEFGASDSRKANPGPVILFKESIPAPNNPNPPYPKQFFKLNFIDKLSSITAMGFLHQSDGTSPLGFGPLMISTKEAIHLAAVNQPRAQWGQMQAFIRVIVYNYGIIGPRAFVNVGQDIFYKSFDGHVYTTSLLASDQLKWGITHISAEMTDSLITRNQHLLKYSDFAYFENRVFVTLKPFIVQALNLFGQPIEDYVSNGIGVLELNNISGLSGNSVPVWAGVYTGIVTGILEIDDKLIVVGKRNEKNVVSQLTEFRTLDYAMGVVKKIRSRIYTREFVFKAPLQDKKVKYVQLDVRNILGKFIAHVYYRTKEEREWKKFGSVYYTPLDLQVRGSISEESICAQAEAVTLGRGIQFRIDIVGEDWELLRFIATGEIYTDIQYERKYDAPFPLTEEFDDVEDTDL